MKGSFFIARRVFLRRRREHGQGHPLIGAALGIALSLIPLITVDHVADAMIEGIISRYRETSTYHFQIRSWRSPDRDEWGQIVEKVVAQDQVQDAWVERQGFGLARGSGSREGLTLRALPYDLYQRDLIFASYIEFDSGEWDLASKDSVLLGREAARRLNVRTGEVIHILTVRRFSGGGYAFQLSEFIVRGVFTSGYQDLDRTWAFISLDAGWEALSPESSRTYIGGKFLPTYLDSRPAAISLGASLPDSWMLYNWRELNRYLLSNLENTRSILLFIMALIILVAVFNVLSSLVMLTLEHRREIGILKCTGTSPRQITQTFMMAGALASLTGTLAGLGGGLMVARFINEIIAFLEGTLSLFSQGGRVSLLNESYYLQTIPIRLRWGATAFIGAATFCLSLAASAIPASRAARLKPLDVLRRH